MDIHEDSVTDEPIIDNCLQYSFFRLLCCCLQCEYVCRTYCCCCEPIKKETNKKENK